MQSTLCCSESSRGVGPGGSTREGSPGQPEWKVQALCFLQGRVHSRWDPGRAEARASVSPAAASGAGAGRPGEAGQATEGCLLGCFACADTRS